VDALVWLLIPVAAFVLALVWLKIAHRTRPPAGTDETVDAHDRFRQAMERETGIEPPSRTALADPADPADPDSER
jgi:hypothetical protein